MKKALVFSKNLKYSLGGAERSIFNEIENCGSSYTFTLASCISNNVENRENLINHDFSSNQWLEVPYKYQFSRFFFNEYLANKKLVMKFFSKFEGEFDEIWAQNIWAPMLLNSLGCRKVYYLRDETSLNIRTNIYSGLKQYLKKVYNMADGIGFASYCKDNLMALEKADLVIANSQYMANELHKKFGIKAEVRLPNIDESSLKKRFKSLDIAQKNEDKGIVFIGDSLVKGIDWVLRLAHDLPKSKFYIYSRKINADYSIGNVNYKVWEKDIVNVYCKADVVIVPSKWIEAYGRVAAEALALDIPAVVTNVGGLPEAVGYNCDLIATDYIDFRMKLVKVLDKL